MADHQETVDYLSETTTTTPVTDARMQMRSYTGTKTLLARPMSRGEYNTYRGWSLPVDEDPTDQGYLVEYPDSPSKADPRHVGYISWSPKDVFERTYVLDGCRTCIHGHVARSADPCDRCVDGDLHEKRTPQAIGSAAPLGSWQERVTAEKDELLDKLDKLTSFLASPKLEELPKEQQHLLFNQLSAMSSYYAILKMRLGEDVL